MVKNMCFIHEDQTVQIHMGVGYVYLNNLTYFIMVFIHPNLLIDIFVFIEGIFMFVYFNVIMSNYIFNKIF
jgi:hypothetical protein